MIDVNLTGTFYTLKLFCENLKTSQGKLLFITSGSAITGTGGGVHYAASKAGQHGLMRAAAKQVGVGKAEDLGDDIAIVSDTSHLTLEYLENIWNNKKE